MKRYVLTLQSITDMGNDYYSFTFLKPDDLQYMEGQYGVFLHVEKEIEGRRMRAFSFASTSDSDTLVIGTKITSKPSDFKRHMLNLQIGDTMTVDGPMGNFTLNPIKHAVFIAGGIGITPIRSIALSLVSSPVEYNLIYSDHIRAYPYQSDLNKVPFTSCEYVSGIEETKASIDRAIVLYDNDAVYYISGSPSFVTGILGQLEEAGIESSNIKFDRFTGY